MAVDKAFLARLPKCEHHMHIEGALSPSVLFTLSARNNIPLPTNDPAYASPSTLAERYANFSGLDDFLSYYYTAMSVLLTAADFETLTWSYLQRAHADGVRHAELFFDPQAHISRGIALSDIISGIRAALKRAEIELGVSSLLIPCFLRHLPASEALDLAHSSEFIAAAQRGEIVGVGLDSSEQGFPPEGFAEAFKACGALGLRRTAHAGEEGPAANVVAALDVLGVERVDHGVRVVEDKDLVARMARQGTLLTLCPLSNVALRVTPTVADSPLRTLLDAGVKFSINSDDPEYLGGYILDNYLAVQEAFGLTREEWQTICTNAIQGSWCDDKRKITLMNMLHECMMK